MPNITNIHIDAALTNVSVKFPNDGFIADDLAPPVMVKKKSDKFFILDVLRDELRQDLTARAPGTPANIADFEVTDDNYSVEERTLTGIVTEEERANVDSAIQADIEKTEFVTKKLLVDKEIKVAAVLSGGISGATPSVKWDVNTSNPIADVKKGLVAIKDSVQAIANVLSLPWEVWLELKDHPLMLERVKAGGSTKDAAIVTTASLAQVFGVDKVVVGKAYKNTSGKGAAASASNIWSDTCYLAVVPARPGLRVLSAAYQFVWNFAGGVNGMAVRRWTDNEVRADKVNVSTYDDRQIIASGAAYKLSSVLT